MRITVRVRPGASRALVGGQYGQPSSDAPPVLVVRVTERAVEGAATAAVVRAVAEALGAPRSAVRVVAGERSRTKILEVDPEPAGAAARVRELLQAP